VCVCVFVCVYTRQQHSCDDVMMHHASKRSPCVYVRMYVLMFVRVWLCVCVCV